MNPTLNIDTIIQRHEAVEQLLHPNNEHWLAEVALILRSVKDINRLISKIQNVRATYSDWALISEVKRRCNVLMVALRRSSDTPTVYCATRAGEAREPGV